MEKEIGFTVISYDENNNSLVVRPYSPLFKKPEDSYPVFNITTTTLDYTQDLKKQIARIMESIIENILNQESIPPENINNQINDLLNKKTILPKKSLLLKKIGLSDKKIKSSVDIGKNIHNSNIKFLN